MARISRELWRPVASAEEARRVYRIGAFHASTDETLAANGWLPNPAPRRPN